MTDSSPPVPVTVLLHRWQSGDQDALDQLVPLVYQELRRLARAQLSRNRKNSIQCTELVAEAYLRLVDVESVDWQDRNHFFSMAARTMRRVLVDQYRQRNTDKRGRNQTVLTYKDDSTPGEDTSVELDSLEEALLALEALDPRQAEIVTLKFYGGLTSDEIAAVLSITPRTIRRDWAVARRWLFQTMQSAH